MKNKKTTAALIIIISFFVISLLSIFIVKYKEYKNYKSYSRLIGYWIPDKDRTAANPYNYITYHFMENYEFTYTQHQGPDTYYFTNGKWEDDRYLYGEPKYPYGHLNFNCKLTIEFIDDYHILIGGSSYHK